MTDRPETDILTALKAPLRQTLAGLWIERLIRALWPAWTLALTLGAALGFGVQDVLPPPVVSVMLGAFLLAMPVAVIVGLWRFTPPTRGDALHRLDGALDGRPLAALADAQAIGADDPASTAVWRAHLSRMRARAVAARPVPGDLKLARFDRLGLRYVALTAFALSLVFGVPSRMAEVTELAQLPGTASAVALGPSWEAWVQPPAYTGRPSLYLNEVGRSALQLPEGSRITVRFYGQPGVMSVAESLSDRMDADGAEMAQDFTVASSGRLSIRGPAGRDWEITMLVDQPPEVQFAAGMVRERGGLMRQDFSASDDYGVQSGSAEITLDLDRVERDFGLASDPEPRPALQVPLPMPLSGSRAEFTESLIDDLSQHPWANLPVTVALQVTDAAGQNSGTVTEDVVLPGRRFFDPLAAAVIELRRDLLWSMENAARVEALMRAIAHRPTEVFRSAELFPRYRAIQTELRASLDTGLDPDTRDGLAQALWDLAVALEEGELADARERLRRAQDRLDEAMRSGADPAEIAELMDELRDALDDYMRQLAEAPRERGEAPPMDGETMEITQDQIQELLDRIQELMEQGRMDEAADLMAQLNALLENLQVTEGAGGQGGGPGQEALEGLGDTLREQQELADDTFRELQDEFGRGDGTGGDDADTDRTDGEGNDSAPRPGSTADDLAERQQDLRNQLRDQQLGTLPGEGTAEGEAALDALERAQRAMEDAEQALRDNDTGEALGRQADALEALREGMRAMNEALSREQRERADSGADGQAEGEGEGRDPLGRSRSAQGEVGTDDSLLQDGDVYRRARDILDEIRRRSAEQDRPEAELDYLRRLLDRFQATR